MTQLFFGLGTGRIASMAIANALNCEMESVALHEGKMRHMEFSGDQFLPFLTLQNRLAYENPEKALELAHQFRDQMHDIAAKKNLNFFGDIAYNNTPFVAAFHELYPEAKFIYLFRDCLSFVRSCTAVDKIDETPVGWPPDDKPLSKTERYIALGRIQPRTGSKEAGLWESWSYVGKNIWLWAETNQLALNALHGLPDDLVYEVRFEDFCADPLNVYGEMRAFLGMTDPMPDEAVRILTDRPINKRIEPIRDVIVKRLDSVELNIYTTYAQPVRDALAYTQ